VSRVELATPSLFADEKNYPIISLKTPVHLHNILESRKPNGVSLPIAWRSEFR
jgi:hypothetical protein